MPKRKIARTLGIDRKSVDRHLRALKSKGATPEEALTTEVLTGSESSKGANALTGSEPLENIPGTQPNFPAQAASTRSECAAFHDLILAKIEQGLSSTRIYQDLVTEHGFSAKYHSVRRYVNRLTSSKQLPVRRIEVEPGYEMQIDYGQGARCRDHTGSFVRLISSVWY